MVLFSPEKSLIHDGIKIHALRYQPEVEQALLRAHDRIYISAFLLLAVMNNSSCPVGNLLKIIAEKVKGESVDVKVVCNHHRPRSRTGKRIESLRYWFDENNIPLRSDPFHSLIHRKMILVDSSSLFIGSHNLSPTGIKNRNEMSVEITSPELIDRVAEDFNRYWNSLWSIPRVDGVTWQE